MTDTNISLRDIQAPLKQQYRDDPESAVITLKADGELGSGVACKVSTGQAMAEAGLHPATGGDGTQLCSGDMLLEALVACAGVTLRAVATALELEVLGAVRAEGDLDFRGTLGVAKDAPVGFREIRLSFDVDIRDGGEPAAEDKVATLVKLTERYCVVLQTIQGSATTSVAVNPAA
ncbi:OsmC family protein [Pseudonocardia sp. DR1-2]|uniref:OsmC family protein n=1 Tax=Pseudonocardia sp. DR1-2 TaxID=2951168 RepID=UPI00204487D9|nr:OsmC family protein [Pseudonocardia sp. DR1-2]MCM3845106.1 OsmC family protein [Pseudonocardia sp. DR1-2]